MAAIIEYREITITGAALVRDIECLSEHLGMQNLKP